MVNFGYRLKRDIIGFIDGLDVGYEKKRGVKGNFKVFGLSNWVNNSVIYLGGEVCGKSRFEDV